MGLGTKMAILAALALGALCVCPAAFATSPGQNGKIAFARDGDVWIVDSDGLNEEQITSGPAIDGSPRWSPDGSAIAFSRHSGDRDRIFIYEIDGSLNRLGDLERVGNPAWAPGGRRMVVRVLGNPNKLFDFPWLSIVSDQGRVIRSHINDLAGAFDSDWSPLGDRIAYAPAMDGIASVFSIDTHGGDSLALSPAPRDLGDFTHDPSWAPDASLVAFGHPQELYCEPLVPNGQSCAYLTQIYVVKSDGSGLTQLTTFDSGHEDDRPTWSPDGTRIVYERSASPFSSESDPTLRAMDADGENDVDLGVVGTQPDWQALVAPRNSERPGIVGVPRSGQELVAKPGVWFGTPELSFTYQWRRCSFGSQPCEDIPGATDPTYVLAEDDAFRTIRLFVTATNDQGESLAWSLATAIVGRTAVGTANDDRLDGTTGGDLLRGLGGDDRLGGGYGDDILFGERGDDRLQGDFGSDELVGGPGADTILGGNSPRFSSVGDGRDEVRGGDGPDWIHVRDARRDVVDCGSGHDVVVADARDQVHGDCEIVKIG
jgi:dipeptidyl aminopeptidase/acylaminoacyl peptidase